MTTFALTDLPAQVRQVLALAEDRDGTGGYVLCQLDSPRGDERVTWRYFRRDEGTISYCWGHYHLDDPNGADSDFLDRAAFSHGRSTR